DFAFALLVGIGAGSYSSIFLAAPLLAMLKEREPEFQRRRDDLGALEGIATVGGTLLDDGPEDDGDDTGGQPVSPPRGPAPTPAPAAATAGIAGPTSSKRERRRQRRASRPHGRSR
ncbi:MAG TPA: hypothetical protein VJ745_06990, partial [Gaiellaceae bacterium]|nr:hypothetical protein [Gaiellaceae bacterium]